jgi:CheY-like chemotaxis protein
MRILIVDDDQICRMSQKEQLEIYGECHAVGNGAAALRMYVDAALGRKPFDVIFMDLQMPVMGGLTSIESIREYEAQHPQHVPQPAKVVVVTSVEELKDLANDFHRNDVVACMKKPLRSKALKRTMATIANSSEAASPSINSEKHPGGPNQHPSGNWHQQAGNTRTAQRLHQKGRFLRDAVFRGQRG